MRAIKQGLLIGSVALASAGFASLSLAADEDKGLPAEQVTAAIEAAVSANPGNIKDVEIDEKDKRLIVEVTIVGSDGKEKEVKVDPQNNEVIR